MSDTNYAQLFGINSLAAAIVFAVIYVPFTLWFITQGIRRPTFVYLFLTIFCQLRVVAFIVRAILAASDSAAHNLAVLITFEILSSVGFAGLLISSYTLVLDRFLLVEQEPPLGVLRILRNRYLFHLAMSAGVAVGVVGTIGLTSSNPSSVSQGQTLHKVGVIILFVLTVLQASQTLMLVRTETEVTASQKPQQGTKSWGETRGHYLLLGIAIFLLVRETFTVATVSNSDAQNNEDLWYPLVALPEVLAIICYAVPGLVPPRSEVHSNVKREYAV